MKKILIVILLLFSLSSFAEKLPAEKARGLFIAFGAGPRFPINDFGASSSVGYGLDLELSYTDNEYIPFFIFLRTGYQQYTGSQSFYKISDHSTLSTTIVPVNFGLRYYFPPLMESIVLFMPIVELSASFGYLRTLHQFKPASGKNNYTENISRFGVSAGAGISMFTMEIVATYNYFQTNQFIGIELKVRLPLYISI